MELNGQEISVLTAAQMGYSITRVSEGENTFAYMIRVPFDDQFVVKQVRFAFARCFPGQHFLMHCQSSYCGFFMHSCVSRLKCNDL